MQRVALHMYVYANRNINDSELLGCINYLVMVDTDALHRHHIIFVQYYIFSQMELYHAF
jgi:hypothetical protein